jgi:hypothetical protein
MGELLDQDHMVSSPFIQELRQALEEGTGGGGPLLELVYTTQMSLIPAQGQDKTVHVIQTVANRSDDVGGVDKSTADESTAVSSAESATASSLGVAVTQLQGYSQFGLLAETMGVFGALGSNGDESGMGGGRWGRRARQRSGPSRQNNSSSGGSSGSNTVEAADFRAQLQLKDSQIVLLPGVGLGAGGSRQRMVVIEGGALIELHRTSDRSMTVWRGVGLGVQAYTMPTYVPRSPASSFGSGAGTLPKREGYNGHGALQLLEPFDVRVEEFHKELSAELSTRGLRVDLSPVELIVSDADVTTMTAVAQGLRDSVAVHKKHQLHSRRLAALSPNPSKSSKEGPGGDQGAVGTAEDEDDDDIEAEFDVRFGDGPLGIRVETVYQYPGQALGWAPEEGESVEGRRMVLSVRSLSQLGPFVANPAEEAGVRADDELLKVFPAPPDTDDAAGADATHAIDAEGVLPTTGDGAADVEGGAPADAAHKSDLAESRPPQARGEEVSVRDFIAQAEAEVEAEMREEEDLLRGGYNDWDSKPQTRMPRESVLKIALSRVSNMLRLQPRPFFIRFRRRRLVDQESGKLSVACTVCTFINEVDPAAIEEHEATKVAHPLLQAKPPACEMCGSILEVNKEVARPAATKRSGHRSGGLVKVTRSTVEVRCGYVSILGCLDSDGVESPLLRINSTDVRGFANTASTTTETTAIDEPEVDAADGAEVTLEIVAGMESTAAVQCFDHRAGGWGTIAHPWPLRLGYVWGNSGEAGAGQQGGSGGAVIPHAVELEAMSELELIVTAPFLRLLGGAGHRLQQKGEKQALRALEHAGEQETREEPEQVVQRGAKPELPQQLPQPMQGAKLMSSRSKGAGGLQQSPYTLINDTGVPLVYWCDSGWDCEWYERAAVEEHPSTQASQEQREHAGVDVKEETTETPCKLKRQWVGDDVGVGAVGTDEWCGGVFLPPGHKSGFRFRERRGRGAGLARFHTSGEGANVRGGARRVTVQLLTTHVQVAAAIGSVVGAGDGDGVGAGDGDGVSRSVDTWRLVQALQADAATDPMGAAAAKTNAIDIAWKAYTAAKTAAVSAQAISEGGILLLGGVVGKDQNALERLRDCGCPWRYKALRGIVVESIGARSMSTALATYKKAASAESGVAYGMPSSLRVVSEVSVCGGVAPTVLRVRSAIQVHNDTQHCMQVLCNHPAWPQPAFIGEVNVNASLTVPLLLGDASEMRVRPAITVAVPDIPTADEKKTKKDAEAESEKEKLDERKDEAETKEENEKGGEEMVEAVVRALEPKVQEFVDVTHVSVADARRYVHKAFNTHVDGAEGLLSRALDDFYRRGGASPSDEILSGSASSSDSAGKRKRSRNDGVGWSGWRLQHQQPLPSGSKDSGRTTSMSNHAWSPPFPILLGGSAGEPRASSAGGGGARGNIAGNRGSESLKLGAGSSIVGGATASTTVGGTTAIKTHQLACSRSNGSPRAQSSTETRTAAQDVAAAASAAHRAALDRAQEYAIQREQRYDRRSSFSSPKHPLLSHPLVSPSVSPASAGKSVSTPAKRMNPFTDDASSSAATAANQRPAPAGDIPARPLSHLEQQKARQLIAPSFFIEATASFATANLGAVTTAVIVSVGLRSPLTLCNALPRPTYFCLGNWSGSEHLVGEPAPAHLLPPVHTLASTSALSPTVTSTPEQAHPSSTMGAQSGGRHLMTGVLAGGQSCALHNIDLRVCAVLWVALGSEGGGDGGVGWGPGLAVRAQDAVDISEQHSSTCVVKEDKGTSTTTAMVGWRDSPSWPRPSLYYHSQNRQQEVALAAKVALQARVARDAAMAQGGTASAAGRQQSAQQRQQWLELKMERISARKPVDPFARATGGLSSLLNVAEDHDRSAGRGSFLQQQQNPMLSGPLAAAAAAAAHPHGLGDDGDGQGGGESRLLLYCDYWLVNHTSLPLCYCPAHNPGNAGIGVGEGVGYNHHSGGGGGDGQAVVMAMQWAPAHNIVTPLRPGPTSLIKISVADSEASIPFSVNAPTVNGVLELPSRRPARNAPRYDVAVTMNLGPAPTLSRTVIVSLSLCYLVLNRTARPVWAWQLGATESGTTSVSAGDGTGAGALLIPPFEARPFFWRDRGARQPFRIAFAVEQEKSLLAGGDGEGGGDGAEDVHEQQQVPSASVIETEGAELVADFLHAITAHGLQHPNVAAGTGGNEAAANAIGVSLEHEGCFTVDAPVLELNWGWAPVEEHRTTDGPAATSGVGAQGAVRFKARMKDTTQLMLAVSAGATAGTVHLDIQDAPAATPAPTAPAEGGAASAPGAKAVQSPGGMDCARSPGGSPWGNAHARAQSMRLSSPKKYSHRNSISSQNMGSKGLMPLKLEGRLHGVSILFHGESIPKAITNTDSQGRPVAGRAGMDDGVVGAGTDSGGSAPLVELGLRGIRAVMTQPTYDSVGMVLQRSAQNRRGRLQEKQQPHSQRLMNGWVQSIRVRNMLPAATFPILLQHKITASVGSTASEGGRGGAAAEARLQQAEQHSLLSMRVLQRVEQAVDEENERPGSTAKHVRRSPKTGAKGGAKGNASSGNASISANTNEDGGRKILRLPEVAINVKQPLLLTVDELVLHHLLQFVELAGSCVSRQPPMQPQQFLASLTVNPFERALAVAIDADASGASRRKAAAVQMLYVIDALQISSLSMVLSFVPVDNDGKGGNGSGSSSGNTSVASGDSQYGADSYDQLTGPRPASWLGSLRTAGGMTGFVARNLNVRLEGAPLVLSELRQVKRCGSAGSMAQLIRRHYAAQMKEQMGSLASYVKVEGWREQRHSEFTGFREDVLDEREIIQKHRRLLGRCASSREFERRVGHLVFDWRTNHTTLSSSKCLVIGIINHSTRPLQLRCSLKSGTAIEILPQWEVGTGTSGSSGYEGSNVHTVLRPAKQLYQQQQPAPSPSTTQGEGGEAITQGEGGEASTQGDGVSAFVESFSSLSPPHGSQQQPSHHDQLVDVASSSLWLPQCSCVVLAYSDLASGLASVLLGGSDVAITIDSPAFSLGVDNTTHSLAAKRASGGSAGMGSGSGRGRDTGGSGASSNGFHATILHSHKHTWSTQLVVEVSDSIGAGTELGGPQSPRSPREPQQMQQVRYGDTREMDFGEGALGLMLEPRMVVVGAGAVDGVIRTLVVGFTRNTDGSAGQAQRSGMVRLHDVVVAAAGQDATTLPFQELLALLRRLPRPLRLGFAQALQ